MKGLKTFFLIASWTVLGTLTAVLVAYLPGALGIVDDYKYGRVIGKLVFPTIAAFPLSAIPYASSAKRAATAMAATILAGYLALDAWAIALHVTGGGRAQRPAMDSPKQ